MIRIITSGGNYGGFDIGDLEDGEEAIERIIEFTGRGIPVLLVEDIEDVVDFGINPNEIEMVSKEEE